MAGIKTVTMEDKWQTVKEVAAFAGCLSAAFVSGMAKQAKNICEFEAKVLTNSAGLFEMAEKGLDEIRNQLLDYSAK